MDKNTLTGLLLMGLVLFGFMYLSKPAETDYSDNNQVEQTAATDAADKQSQLFTPADSASLAGAVRAMGTADGGALTFANENLSLQLDSVTGLSGTYTDGGESYDIREILANRAALTTARAARAAQSIRTIISNAKRYEGFARYLGGDNKEVVLENDLVKLTLNTRGGRIAQAELKKYKTELATDSADSNVKLFRDATDGYNFQFNTADQRINTADFNFTPVTEGDTVVWMTLAPAAGVQWAIRYRLDPDSYVVRMELVQKGMDRILPASTSAIDFNWHQKMARNEVGRSFEERNSAIMYKYVGEGVDELSANKDDRESLSGRLRWVAFKNQFFSSIIIAREPFNSAQLTSLDIKDDTYLKDMTMAATLPYSPADGYAASFDFFLGPNEYPMLSKLDDKLAVGEDLKLTNIVPLGWTLFRWINTLIIIPVFTFLGSFITNYGLIILLLTIFIKIIIFPFTYKSFKSQAKMRVLAPEIKEINEKYPGQENAMKRSSETMALYSRAGANPMSGCLPMMLQMPVLIAMFSFFPSAIELRGQSFLWAHNLAAPDYICTLPFTIPFYGNHVSLFCLLMTIVNIVYMRVSMQSQPTSEGMPGMKVMQYMMPLMFLFFFNDYAAALSYYYLLSLLITIIQTWIFRKCVNENKVREEMLANARKPKKKSNWMARLEEANRKQQAALRAQQQQQGNRRERRNK